MITFTYKLHKKTFINKEGYRDYQYSLQPKNYPWHPSEKQKLIISIGELQSAIIDLENILEEKDKSIKELEDRVKELEDHLTDLL